MANKLPAFQFYPGDWMKDPNLRRCSHAAKGVLIDIMCLMFECDERGVLATSGVAWTDDEIAQAIGGDRITVIGCITELTLKGVLPRNQSGALYSKRMVRDEHKRSLCAEAGRYGGGNPTLRRTYKGAAKGASKGASKGGLKQNPTPSSSSSSSEEIPADAGLPLEPLSDGDDVPDTPPATPSRKPPDGPHAAICRYWCEAWERKYGQKYAFASKDGVAVATILKQLGSPHAVESVINVFLAEKDSFYEGHQLTMLRSQINKFNAIASKRTASSVPNVDGGSAQRRASQAANEKLLAQYTQTSDRTGGNPQ